jgi:hypothetical protein
MGNAAYLASIHEGPEKNGIHHAPIGGHLDSIVCGDAGTVLREIPAGSANAIVTSPPYFQQRD